MKALFFVSLFLILYVYIGYPALVYAIGRVWRRDVRKGAYEGSVTVLIAAFNEEACIGETIRNKLGQDFPEDRLEILVVSDGSTDRTDEIVMHYASDRVKLLRQPERGGKTRALNAGVRAARGDVIVFSDANSMYRRDALRMLLRSFEDPEVGYVTGKMMYANTDGSDVGASCSAYMKYENRIRQWETRVGSIVGVDGGIDAVRRELYVEMREDQLPDFVLPMKVVEQGYRVVYEPEAVVVEPALGTSGDEYRMRVRVSLRALWAMHDMRGLLLFRDSILFGWQLWSHKALRYLCFLFLAACYVSNLALWREGELYRYALLAQSGGYVGAAASHLLERAGYRVRALYLLKYFILVNLASGVAFTRFLAGRKQVLWTPRKG